MSSLLAEHALHLSVAHVVQSVTVHRQVGVAVASYFAYWPHGCDTGELSQYLVRVTPSVAGEMIE